ncbi:MAG: DEAD/DEAH box helicase family protein [Gammaproteobacteria bacterium]|nr:DEAD/DEAH box helicase family protein [Gammaproteobacteria bacterium]
MTFRSNHLTIDISNDDMTATMQTESRSADSAQAKKSHGKKLLDYVEVIEAAHFLEEKFIKLFGVEDKEEASPYTLQNIIRDLLNKKEIPLDAEYEIQSLNTNKKFTLRIEKSASGEHQVFIQGSDQSYVLIVNDGIHFKVDPSQPTFHDPKSLKPRKIQLKAIRAFGEALYLGETTLYAVMGTGSGKSFVAGGIAHALKNVDNIILVTRDANFARELKDAIKLLLGTDAADKTSYSIDYDIASDEGKANFLAAISDPNAYLILLTEDPQYAEKAALIQNKLIVIDEAHEHTSCDEKIAIALTLIQNNTIIGLTGTPNVAMKQQLFQQKPPTVEVSVRDVINAGFTRRVNPAEAIAKRFDVPAILAAEYFGQSAFLDQHEPNYKSPIALFAEQKNGERAQDICMSIDAAIQNNRLSNLWEKNFIFSNETAIHPLIADYFIKISEGTLPADQLAYLTYLVEALLISAQSAQARKYLQTLIDHFENLGCPLTANEIETIQKHINVNELRFPPVNLQDFCFNAQLLQITTSINACALHVIFGGNIKDYEKALRTDTLHKILLNDIYKKTSKADQMTRFNELYPNLSPDQLDAFKKLVKQVMHRINDANSTEEIEKNLTGTIHLVDLNALKAHYIASVNENTPLDEQQAVLDQLRCGLVMHVLSDRTFATGISINSVLSTEVAVTSTADIDTTHNLQSFGRALRDNYGIATAIQVVSEPMAEAYPSIVSPQTVVSEKAGEEALQIMEQHEVATASFHRLQRQLTPAISSPTPLAKFHRLYSTSKLDVQQSEESPKMRKSSSSHCLDETSASSNPSIRSKSRDGQNQARSHRLAYFIESISIEQRIGQQDDMSVQEIASSSAKSI